MSLTPECITYPLNLRFMKKTKGYTKDLWKGHTKYNCNYCPFDTLDENVIKDHIRKEHTEPPKKEPPQVPMNDRFGNPIVDKFGNQLYKTGQ